MVLFFPLGIKLFETLSTEYNMVENHCYTFILEELLLNAKTNMNVERFSFQ